MIKQRKLCLLGAAGGIGQPLSLLLKSDYNLYSEHGIASIALYDIVNMGMAVDLSHICTPIKVTGYCGDEQLSDALVDSDIVIVTAGVPRKPGMTRDDLFNINAKIVKHLTLSITKSCPSAHILLISNPVNSLVPLVVEVMKKGGVERPSVFGITSLDLIRAKTFLAEALSSTNGFFDPQNVNIPVIGGHSGTTIVPLLSHHQSPLLQSKEALEAITKRVQFGGDEVVKAKAGAGSATLSMAYSAKYFLVDFLKGLKGIPSVSVYAYYHDGNAFGDMATMGYFSGPVLLGRNGLEKSLPLPKMSPFERSLYEAALPEIRKDVGKGIEFAHANPQL